MTPAIIIHRADDRFPAARLYRPRNAYVLALDGEIIGGPFASDTAAEAARRYAPAARIERAVVVG